jgi:hypothetical protein
VAGFSSFASHPARGSPDGFAGHSLSEHRSSAETGSGDSPAIEYWQCPTFIRRGSTSFAANRLLPPMVTAGL